MLSRQRRLMGKYGLSHPVFRPQEANASSDPHTNVRGHASSVEAGRANRVSYRLRSVFISGGIMSTSEKCPVYTWLLWGTMLVVVFFTAISAQSQQASARKASQPLKATVTLPEWGISDDEFKSLLLRVETILPIYESSLKDIETYLGKQSDISYQTGKMIQDDIGTLRTDIAGTRRTVSSLRGSRSVLNEIELAEGLFVLDRYLLDSGNPKI